MSTVPMTPAEARASRNSRTRVGASLVLIGAIGTGLGVVFVWLKLTGRSVKVDFAGGIVHGRKIPPIHLTRPIPILGSPTATAWGVGHWIAITLLIAAVVMLVLGMIVLIQGVTGRDPATAALVVAAIAVGICVYFLVRKDSLGHSVAAFHLQGGHNLDTFIKDAVSRTGITGLTASLQLSTSLQYGFIISAIGSLVALIGSFFLLASRPSAAPAAMAPQPPAPAPAQPPPPPPQAPPASSGESPGAPPSAPANPEG